jgi:hypothetical protein
VIGFQALDSQAPLFKPLSETPGFETYLLPILGNPMWTIKGGVEDDRVNPFLKSFSAIPDGVRKAGLGTTILQTGVFTDFFLDSNYKSVKMSLIVSGGSC